MSPCSRALSLDYPTDRDDNMSWIAPEMILYPYNRGGILGCLSGIYSSIDTVAACPLEIMVIYFTWNVSIVATLVSRKLVCIVSRFRLPMPPLLLEILHFYRSNGPAGSTLVWPFPRISTTSKTLCHLKIDSKSWFSFLSHDFRIVFSVA